MSNNPTIQQVREIIDLKDELSNENINPDWARFLIRLIDKRLDNSEIRLNVSSCKDDETTKTGTVDVKETLKPRTDDSDDKQTEKIK